MPSARILRSIAHNIGDHTKSFFSYLVPHLFRAAVRADCLSVTLDFLATPILPPTIDPDEPLRKSAAGLKDRFNRIVVSEGFSLADLSAATVTFHFEPVWPENPLTIIARSSTGYQRSRDDAAFHGEVRLTAIGGRVYSSAFHSWHFGP